jgi:uncharacterized lipoprotein YddW (UPF0748 family)
MNQFGTMLSILARRFVFESQGRSLRSFALLFGDQLAEFVGSVDHAAWVRVFGVPLPQVLEKTVHVVTSLGRQFVLYLPEFVSGKTVVRGKTIGYHAAVRTRKHGLRSLLAGLAILAVSSAPALWAANYRPCAANPPKPLREFRAVWVATVGNIDWPSKKDLTTAEQQAELLAILDRAAQLKLNVVIFQVRPACDALYASKLEPWSEYLTGAMGKPPEPYYDPLAFAVEEAHKRGLELHAWFNPYRARHISGKSPAAPSHISKTRPQIVRQYGRYLWLDPGEKEAQDHSLKVILDVVKRYDIDGVHFDDYFYPYAEQDASGKELDFPDEQTWRRFGAKQKLTREDWRRENVDGFIQRVYDSIKAEKRWVKFGISPFGIWRPGYPAQIEGLDAYGKLYADSRKWLARGWVDYFAPQLYWAIESPQQSFAVLLEWWVQQNPKARLLAPGMNSSNVERRWKPEEILNQIRLARSQPGVAGHVHWSLKSLMPKSTLADALERSVYAQPALVPASPWLGRTRPAKPTLAAAPLKAPDRLEVNWSTGRLEPASHWVLQTRAAGRWKTEILPGNATSRAWHGAVPEVVAVSAVDRNGNLGPPAAVGASF